MPLHYVGSGPYCYANSLRMVLGPLAPEVSAIEVLTGSPFGLHLRPGLLASFDPLGWDPGLGLDAALDLIGWECERAAGGSAAEAVRRLRDASGPVLVGPVEMGLLRHQPGSGQVIGADHFVVVLGVDGADVLFHDPHGYPFATLPVAAFIAAWAQNSFGYPAEPFTMRTGFRRVRSVDVHTALRRSLPAARRWLTPPADAPTASAERLAGLVEVGLTAEQTGHLVQFAVRVGAHRLADAAEWLGRVGHHEAAAVAAHQAQLVGGLQHPLVQGDRTAAAALLRRLAPTYAELAAALAAP
jgi:hypothetical protein